MERWLLQGGAGLSRNVLFITHDGDEAIFLSDRVVVMSARPGRIERTFTIDFERPRRLELLTSDPFTALKREVLSLLYQEDEREAGVA